MKNKNGKADHSTWGNYDNLNKYFWLELTSMNMFPSTFCAAGKLFARDIIFLRCFCFLFIFSLLIDWKYVGPGVWIIISSVHNIWLVTMSEKLRDQLQLLKMRTEETEVEEVDVTYDALSHTCHAHFFFEVANIYLCICIYYLHVKTRTYRYQ